MLYVLLGVLAVLSALVILPFWSYVLGGLLLGYVGYTPYKWFLRRIRHQTTSAALSLLLLLIIILAPLGWMGFQLVVQAQDLASQFTADEVRGTLEVAANWTRANFGWPAAAENETTAQTVIDQVVPQARRAFLEWLPNAATFLAQFLVGIFVALFIGYYAIRDGDRLVDFIEDALPLRPATEQRLLEEVRETLEAVFFGQVLTALIQGALLGVGFWLFGVPAPVFWAFMAAVLSVLPIIGPPIIWGPAAAFLVVQGETGKAIGLFIWGAILVSTSDNWIKPKLMAQRSGMHPAIALIGLIGGLVAFGFMGFIIGPVILALFLVLVNIYIEQRRETMLAEPDEGDASAWDREESEAPPPRRPVTPTDPPRDAPAGPDADEPAASDDAGDKETPRSGG